MVAEELDIFDADKELKAKYYSYIAPLYVDMRDDIRFQYEIELTIDSQVKSLLKYCIMSEWNEGVLICEKEIERRGLHIDDPKKRFDL